MSMTDREIQTLSNLGHEDAEVRMHLRDERHAVWPMLQGDTQR